MTVNRDLRNVVIVLALAAAVDYIPGGGPVSNTILQVLYIAFLVAFAWIASRLYREHRLALDSLGDRRRAIVYGAAGVATVTFCASSALLNGSGIGIVVWLLLLAACAYAVFEVVRSARSY